MGLLKKVPEETTTAKSLGADPDARPREGANLYPESVKQEVRRLKSLGLSVAEIFVL